MPAPMPLEPPVTRATLPLNDFACTCHQNPLSHLLCPFWIILSRMAVQRDRFPGCPTRSFFLSLWFSQRVHRQRKALDEPTSGLFECISRWRSAWCRNTELSDPADSDTTKEAPHGKYVLHRLRCSQENDQLLRQGCQRSNPRRGQDSCDAVRSGPVDEDSTPALDGSNGSRHLHRLDLRSS